MNGDKAETEAESVVDFLESTRRQFLQATGGLSAAAFAGTAAAAEGNDNSGNGESGLSDRVGKLLSELSLEEKVGQMTQIEITALDPETEYEQSDAIETIGDLFTEYGVGSLLSGGATAPAAPDYDPEEVQKGLNDLQEFAIENTDSGIPFVYGLDAVHGNVTVDGATAFPHNPGLGATRDPELVGEVGRATGESVAAVGAHWNFSPVADLQRDPRWGRFYEGFSEDPYLTSLMVEAMVSGMEYKEDGKTAIGSTTKHFVGYSQPENGNDRSPAHIPGRQLGQKHFPPFEAGIAAGTETIMVNSGSVNGIPVHASEYLLTEVLRDHWGFEGVLISDWMDFQRMVEMHEYVPTFRDAVREGINAGVDMYMVPYGVGEFVSTLVDLVETDEVPEARIDEAVARILRYKERLGLFDDPYADADVDAVIGSDRDVAQRATTESLTLLKNDEETLPLDDDPDSVVVAGPSADSVRNQMGGWTLAWQGLPEDIEAEPAAVTVLGGIEEVVSSGTDVTHIPTGFTWNPYAEDEFSFEKADEVASAAEDADAVVLVLGEGPYSEGFGNTNTLELPEAQRDLIETAAGTDTPVVGVMIAGRPRGTEPTFEPLDAAIMAYQPGTAAGPAVADVLFGAKNPSGRLPFTWPQSVGQVINVHNHLPPALFDGVSPQEPLFEFGHGLSYTDFEYSELGLSPGSDPNSSHPSGTLEVAVTVHNAGEVAGTDVVHAYNTQAYGSVIYPDEQLMGFERVSLDPGDSERVKIEAPLSTLMVVPGDIAADPEELVLEDGKYAVSVGDLTETFVLGSSGYTDWELAEDEEDDEDE